MLDAGVQKGVGVGSPDQGLQKVSWHACFCSPHLSTVSYIDIYKPVELKKLPGERQVFTRGEGGVCTCELRWEAEKPKELGLACSNLLAALHASSQQRCAGQHCLATALMQGVSVKAKSRLKHAKANSKRRLSNSRSQLKAVFMCISWLL